MQYNVYNIKPTRDGEVLAEAEDRTLDVEFPESYDHLNDPNSPIEDTLVRSLNEEGYDCDGALFSAIAVDGSAHEEHIRIRMGSAQ